MCTCCWSPAVSSEPLCALMQHPGGCGPGVMLSIPPHEQLSRIAVICSWCTALNDRHWLSSAECGALRWLLGGPSCSALASLCCAAGQTLGDVVKAGGGGRTRACKTLGEAEAASIMHTVRPVGTSRPLPVP